MFAVSFVIENKYLGDALTALERFKPKDVETRPTVNAKAKGRANGVPAWQVVVNIVRSAKHPVQAKDVAAALEAAGFSRAGISTHLATAREKKLIRKTAKGYIGGTK